MQGSTTTRGIRALGLALLGVAALLFGCAREVRASGCHAEQRPEFGLTTRLDGSGELRTEFHESGATTAPTGRVAPRPCQGEIPRAPVGGAEAVGPALATAERFVPTTVGPESRLSEPDDRLQPRTRSEVPRRPPRPAV